MTINAVPGRPQSALSPVQGSRIAGAPDEPVLDVHDIQGSVLVGFNKDHQHFLFFQIDEVAAAKRWLNVLAPQLATVEETLAFRRLFRALRERRGSEPAGMIVTWINVAFTYEGIRKLTSDDEARKFESEAFRAGLAERSSLLGDPVDPNAAGHPNSWLVGNRANRPDILMIIASDSGSALRKEVARVKRDLRGGPRGPRSNRPLHICYEQSGANLIGQLAGHEHFGFKDGISQPGVRGRVAAGTENFLTPRLVDPSDPHALKFAKPGQPLIWPGQFVLGYPQQADSDDLNPTPPTADPPPWPVWARNGSFLVFRRLRQDVAGFWGFVRAASGSLRQIGGFTALTPERFASMLIGRWPSGAPIMRSPDTDNASLSVHPTAGNNFRFSEDTETMAVSADIPADVFPPAVGDSQGVRCPFAAHIRKVNPRDDTTDLGGGKRTLRKRILRRGIPYGPQVDDPQAAQPDNVDRGLLFLSYQSSIEDQFEFLAQNWLNHATLPKNYDAPNPDAGTDPILGQDVAAANPVRVFTLRGSDGSYQTVQIVRSFVIPTGGDYFFTPSISAIQNVLSN